MAQAMSDSWKLVLPCTRDEAEILSGELEALAALDPPPAIVTHEPDPARPDHWELNAYFDAKPDRASVALLASLVPSARGAIPRIERVADADWVTLSQAGIEPVRAGRFFVHTGQYRGAVPMGATAFRIDAGRAFGTGGHQTTSGCLALLDRLARRGLRFASIADIGTGTGLLAFAAQRLWPRAMVLASDSDPVAVDVARDNARANRVPLGSGPGAIALFAASGMDHDLYVAHAPFDLVIANILAGPLIELAPAFGALLAPGGRLILAGLLTDQIPAVAAACRRGGMLLESVSGDGDWPCLCLRKRSRYGWRRPARAELGTSQPPGDFGSW